MSDREPMFTDEEIREHNRIADAKKKEALSKPFIRAGYMPIAASEADNFPIYDRPSQYARRVVVIDSESLELWGEGLQDRVSEQPTMSQKDLQKFTKIDNAIAALDNKEAK